MAKLALAWPLRRRAVSAIAVGVRSVDQLTANIEAGDWDMPEDLWRTLEERTRPTEEYLTFFNRWNYDRFAGATEFQAGLHDLL
jgi:hypothetical protein